MSHSGVKINHGHHYGCWIRQPQIMDRDGKRGKKHQILELTDKAYQACRKKLGSKRNLWEKLRDAIHFFIFESWEKMLNFLLMSTDERNEFIKNLLESDIC
jgi:hypothetical protein